MKPSIQTRTARQAYQRNAAKRQVLLRPRHTPPWNVSSRAAGLNGASVSTQPRPLGQILSDAGLQHLQGLYPAMQQDKVQQATYRTSMGGASVWVGTTLVVRDHHNLGCVCITAAPDHPDNQPSLSGLTLHWGVSKGVGQGWKPPPAGWTTEPSESWDAGNNAWQTKFDTVQQPDGSTAYVMSLELPLERPVRDGGLCFVLKTDQNAWIKEGDHHQDFFVSLQAVQDREPALVESSNGASGKDTHGADGPDTRRGDRDDNEIEGAASPANQAAEIELFLDSFLYNHHDIMSLTPDPAVSAQSGGGPCWWMVDKIASMEGKAERSLMHRYDLAAQLMGDAMHNEGAELEDAVMGVAVWLRYAATRHLTWNRNYNVKPREISAAQDRLANKLSECMLTRRHAHDAARLGLVATGRGGQGDVGQRIRDEILTVQQRNGAKGGMMEEWHQKLHNNTSPDDVVICQALLEYIRSGCDIQAYWSTLAAENITRERLASFDRPIVSEPKFNPQQCPGLERDLEAYLVTLKAVHTGTDLQAAAAAVFGYKQQARKGRSVSVPPVEGVCTPQLKSLVQAVLYMQSQTERSIKEAALLLKLVASARFELSTHQHTDCGGRLKDVIFLDMALDNAARAVLESVLGEVKALPSSAPILELVVNLLRPAVENAALSATDTREFAHSISLLDRAVEDCDSGVLTELDAHMLCLSAFDRIRRELVRVSDSLAQRVQPTAEALGSKLGIPSGVVSIFSEEVVRGTSAAPLAQLLAVLEHRLRQSAGAGDWVIISRGQNNQAIGTVLVEHTLAAVQENVYEQPVVLLVDSVRGEEEVPVGAVAVISRECPDVLCHAAVRARNNGVLFAGCENEERFRAMCQGLPGRIVHVWIENEDEVIIQETDQAAVAAAAAAGPSSSSSPEWEVKPVQWCGLWVLAQDRFEPGRVGGKSMSTRRLEGKLPPGVEQPVSAALPFGVFERLLQEPENLALAMAMQDVGKQAESDMTMLSHLRSLTQDVQSVPELSQHLLTTLQHYDVPVTDASWEGIWHATRRVWASRWNDRAALALRKFGVQLSSLSMAVLVQEMIPMDYAFVVHTSNPMNGHDDEVLVDIVVGMGETLVGNYPGKPLTAIVSKKGLAFLREQLDEGVAIGEVAVPEDWAVNYIELLNYPSKTVALVVPAEYDETPLIARSDSNAEDLPFFAGAGLFDSHPTVPLEPVVVDYTQERLVISPDFRNKLVARVALVCCMVEEVLDDGPQDIEGGLSEEGVLYVVQSRPQV